jgi:hypothetical protein
MTKTVNPNDQVTKNPDLLSVHSVTNDQHNKTQKSISANNKSPDARQPQLPPMTPTPILNPSNNNYYYYINKTSTVADLIKTPLPILVMGMPKAGTSSLAQYFQCGLGTKLHHRVSHYECAKGNQLTVFNASLLQKSARVPCGIKLTRNADHKRHAFTDIDHFDVYTELDASLGSDRLFLPQISYTRAIYEAYPNATWILNVRDSHAWVASISTWRDLRQRFIGSTFKLSWFGKGVGQHDEEMLYLYNYSIQYIQDYAVQHPSLTFVQVKVDDPNAGEILENNFGIHRTCWGKHNINPKSNPKQP